jgi:hypothetical protein
MVSVVCTPAAHATIRAAMLNALRLRVESMRKSAVTTPQMSTTAKMPSQTNIQKRPDANTDDDFKFAGRDAARGFGR